MDSKLRFIREGIVCGLVFFLSFAYLQYIQRGFINEKQRKEREEMEEKQRKEREEIEEKQRKERKEMEENFKKLLYEKEQEEKEKIEKLEEKFKEQLKSTIHSATNSHKVDTYEEVIARLRRIDNSVYNVKDGNCLLIYYYDDGVYYITVLTNNHVLPQVNKLSHPIIEITQGSQSFRFNVKQLNVAYAPPIQEPLEDLNIRGASAKVNQKMSSKSEDGTPIDDRLLDYSIIWKRLDPNEEEDLKLIQLCKDGKLICWTEDIDFTFPVQESCGAFIITEITDKIYENSKQFFTFDTRPKSGFSSSLNHAIKHTAKDSAMLGCSSGILLHKCPTVAGFSGAPLISNKTFKVIGIHTGSIISVDARSLSCELCNYAIALKAIAKSVEWKKKDILTGHDLQPGAY